MRRFAWTGAGAAMAAGFTIFAAGAAAAQTLPEIDDSLITGFYSVMDEEYALLMTGNGVIWQLDLDPEDEDGFSNFHVYGSSREFLIVHDEGTAIYFRQQTEKEPSGNGGIYYAAYDDFLGTEEEVEFHEGSQVLVNGYIFDNDYQVVLRQPLSAFYRISENGERETEAAETEGD